MNGQVLSMDEAKQKLTKLEELIPDAPSELIYEFGRYLAGRLNAELLPEGFVMASELALYDLQKGVNGFTGEPIQNSLVGYPSVIYAFLRIEIPRIAEAIFPADFAESVKAFINKVSVVASKKRAAE